MVKIISDSTCDLSPDLLQKYDIDILPLHILPKSDSGSRTPPPNDRVEYSHEQNSKRVVIAMVSGHG